MSECAEIFAGMAELRRQRRAANTMSSTELLTERGIQFESKNGGAHLVVQADDHLVDFWPSGGRWIARNASKTNGRGVFKLLRYLGK